MDHSSLTTCGIVIHKALMKAKELVKHLCDLVMDHNKLLVYGVLLHHKATGLLEAMNHL